MKNRDSISTILINILFVFKPIVDMLYQWVVLDYSLFIIVLLILLLNIDRIYLQKRDWLLIIFSILLTLSFFKNINGFNTYIKILSSIILIFALRGEYKGININLLALSYAFVVLLSFTLYVFKIGFVTWGNASTFKSLYYYKTDLACALSQGLIIFLFKVKANKFYLVLILISLLLTYYTNSRVSLVIDLAILLLYFYKLICDRKKIKLKPRLNAILICLGVCIGLVILYNFVITTFSSNNNYLTIDLLDMLSNSNTQGRSVIWSKILYIYNNASIINKIFGINLTDDLVPHNGSYYGSHSMYLKALFSCGLLGLLVLLLYFICILKLIFNFKSNNNIFLVGAALLILLLNGLTISVLEFTQFSWFPILVYSYSKNCNEYEKDYVRDLNTDKRIACDYKSYITKLKY